MPSLLEKLPLGCVLSRCTNILAFGLSNLQLCLLAGETVRARQVGASELPSPHLQCPTWGPLLTCLEPLAGQPPPYPLALPLPYPSTLQQWVGEPRIRNKMGKGSWRLCSSSWSKTSGWSRYQSPPVSSSSSPTSSAAPSSSPPGRAGASSTGPTSASPASWPSASEILCPAILTSTMLPTLQCPSRKQMQRLCWAPSTCCWAWPSCRCASTWSKRRLSHKCGFLLARLASYGNLGVLKRSDRVRLEK